MLYALLFHNDRSHTPMADTGCTGCKPVAIGDCYPLVEESIKDNRFPLK